MLPQAAGASVCGRPGPGAFWILHRPGPGAFWTLHQPTQAAWKDKSTFSLAPYLPW